MLLLSLGSDTLSEPELNDLAQNFIRTQLVTVRGASVGPAYGGKWRQIVADLDSDALYARNLLSLIELGFDFEDEVVKGACVVRDCKVVER